MPKGCKQTNGQQFGFESFADVEPDWVRDDLKHWLSVIGYQNCHYRGIADFQTATGVKLPYESVLTLNTLSILYDSEITRYSLKHRTTPPTFVDSIDIADMLEDVANG